MTRVGVDEIPRLGQCALMCVDPARVQEVWPHVEAFIAKAYMNSPGDESFEEVRDSVFVGHSLLWIVWAEDEKAILAAGTTKLIGTRRGKLCLITSLAGRDIIRWRRFIEEIEKYAKCEGCAAVRIYGRPGWERLLRGYTKPWVTIEKAL